MPVHPEIRSVPISERGQHFENLLQHTPDSMNSCEPLPGRSISNSKFNNDEYGRWLELLRHTSSLRRLDGNF
jgi:hypothetical protein